MGAGGRELVPNVSRFYPRRSEKSAVKLCSVPFAPTSLARSRTAPGLLLRAE